MNGIGPSVNQMEFTDVSIRCFGYFNHKSHQPPERHGPEANYWKEGRKTSSHFFLKKQ